MYVPAIRVNFSIGDVHLNQYISTVNKILKKKIKKERVLPIF